MDIQAIGVRAFSVYIPESELLLRHLTPASITAVDARTLVGNIIGSGSTDAVSLELYPGRHEVLIFVRRSTGEPDFYSFEDLEGVLAAIAALDSGVSASLFCRGGLWILAVWPDGSGVRPDLTEFGDRAEIPPEYLLHAREHGKMICDGDAVETLQSAFLSKVTKPSQ